MTSALMVAPRAQGQNVKSTLIKEACFGVCLSYDIANYRNRTRARCPYLHMDLNAGIGRNHVGKCIGTPLVFRNAARKHGIPFRAWFVDKRKDSVNRLKQALGLNHELFPNGSRHKYEVECLDNRDFLTTAVELAREHWPDQPLSAVRGCILADPNGISEKRGGFPIEAIGRVAKALPGMTILIRWDYRAARVTGGYLRKYPDRPMTTVTLKEILRAVHRPHWLVANEPTLRSKQSTVLCGSSYQIPPYAGNPSMVELTADLRAEFSGEPR